MKRLKKSIYIKLCCGTLALLAVVRWTFPGVTGRQVVAVAADSTRVEACADSLVQLDPVAVPEVDDTTAKVVARPPRKWHPLGGVHSYKACFPDLQDTQIVAARKWGVKPVRDRQMAEKRKSELVYVACNPYYVVDPAMKSSIPYLVPRAGNLLQRIGKNFLDSLYVRGIPMHKIIVSSILRTTEDVKALQKYNANAVEQSCHCFGTTVDIRYTHYHTVTPPDEPKRRTVSDDTLKWVLSQVLRDLREEGACYVKHEVKQGCFHLTVR